MADSNIYKILPHTFAWSLTVSETLTLYICDLQKVGRGHEVQFLQRHNSRANVKCTRNSRTLLLLPFQRYYFVMFDAKKISQSHGTRFSQWRHVMAPVYGGRGGKTRTHADRQAYLEGLWACPNLAASVALYETSMRYGDWTFVYVFQCNTCCGRFGGTVVLVPWVCSKALPLSVKWRTKHRAHNIF